MASAGCRKKAGVPVLASVAAILLPMWPDLPMPVTTTLPRAGEQQARRHARRRRRGGARARPRRRLRWRVRGGRGRSVARVGHGTTGACGGRQSTAYRAHAFSFRLTSFLRPPRHHHDGRRSHPADPVAACPGPHVRVLPTTTPITRPSSSPRSSRASGRSSATSSSTRVSARAWAAKSTPCRSRPTRPPSGRPNGAARAARTGVHPWTSCRSGAACRSTAKCAFPAPRTPRCRSSPARCWPTRRSRSATCRTCRTSRR